MCFQRRCKPGPGWQTSELLTHFEQPHPTNIIFHYSPTVLPRRKHCDSSNLSPTDWAGKGARTPGWISTELPSYPDQVTRIPHSAVWHQKLICTGGPAARMRNLTGWKQYRRGACTQTQNCVVSRTQGDSLCTLLTENLKGLGQCNTPWPGCTLHGSLQGQRQTDHLFNLSRLSTDSKANS